MNLPHFLDTYDEYLWLREQLGYAPEIALFRSVWEGCTAEAREDMLGQLRRPVIELRMQAKAREHYGDAW